MGHFFTFVFAILLVGLTILTLVVIFIVRLLRGNARSNPEESRNEAKMIQELYHGFSRMEERVEALETLLLDAERPKRTEDDRQ